MKSCPTCNNTYPTDYTHCPRDLAVLVETGVWSEGNVVREKYRILAHLGSGGMAAVYKAEHLHFHEMRALKVITQNLAGDKKFIQRFIQEAVITRRLQHPNAVRIDDMDLAEDGRPFIVMEYLDGSSLGQVMAEQGPMPAARVCAIARQVAAALDAAHRLGIVHRDIKPANIILVPTPEGEQAKVLDFGIAKMKEAHLGDTQAQQASLTGTGLLIGTAAYMSPEQAIGKKGEALDGRSDVYSLGVVMYQMLAGELPLKADSDVGLLMAHINTPPAPLREAHPEVPEALASLVMKCLEKRREARPASARALMEEIEAAQTGIPASSAPSRPTVGVSSPYSLLAGDETELLERLQPASTLSGAAAAAASPTSKAAEPEIAGSAPSGAAILGNASLKYFALAAVLALVGVGIAWMVVRNRTRHSPHPVIAAETPPSVVAASPTPAPGPEATATPVLLQPATVQPASGPLPSRIAKATPAGRPERGNPKSTPQPAAVSTPAPTATATPEIPSDPRKPYTKAQDAFRQKKFDEALRLFGQAADAGDARAMDALGNMYAQGLGVGRDPQQAQQWYEKAAKAGNGDAMYRLGHSYDLAEDYPQARQWYEKAVEAGNTDAMNDLGYMLEWGRGTDKNYHGAQQLYEQARAAGSAKALYHLGYMYELGHGVAKDHVMARELYVKAGEDEEALFRLGYMFERGLGGTKDHQRARQLYEQVATHDSQAGRSAQERLRKLDPGK